MVLIIIAFFNYFPEGKKKINKCCNKSSWESRSSDDYRSNNFLIFPVREDTKTMHFHWFEQRTLYGLNFRGLKEEF